MDFTEFNLNEDLMKGLEKAGYTVCTPVQEQVLKSSQDGADLYVQSQTGTGKTAAYLISIIQEMLTRPEAKGKKAIIMVPTRELAVQVEQEAKTLISGTELKAASFYGGVGYEQQTAMLKQDVDILVGTPGRVIDLQESGKMDLSNVAFLVIDEADRMSDMGFYPDLRTLIKVLPPADKRQTMLFSATLNSYVKNLAWEYTIDAKEITIEAERITVDEIDQILLHVASDDKMKLLVGILKNEKPESVIVFCNTKRACEVISKRLKINGIESEFIIGDLPQSKRMQVLESFKRGSLTCLVATDVAARGIDINDLSMVVNYDLPNEPENYVHRIGRTARAGKTGKAYTFCSEQDVYNLVPIERYIEGSIPASMATQDMFGEDASAGMYIRTNTYSDDRDDHRHGRKGSFDRSGPRRDSRGDRNGRRDRKPGRIEHIDGTKTINSIRAATGAEPITGNTQPKPESPRTKSGAPRKNRRDYTAQQDRRNSTKDFHIEKNDKDVDISALSFDERMKLYKEKYAAAAHENAARKAAKANAKTPAAKNGRYKKTADSARPAGQSKTAAGSPAKRTAPDGKKTARSDNRTARKNTAKPDSKKQNKETVKGVQNFGLIGKISSLFGKNK